MLPIKTMHRIGWLGPGPKSLRRLFSISSAGNGMLSRASGSRTSTTHALRGAQSCCGMSSTADATRTVVLIPGDGIGPEISDAVKKVFAAARVPIRWEEHLISTKNVVPGQDLIPSAVLDSIRRHGYGVKGPLETPIGKGHKSLNLTLRQALGLYANVRPCRTVPGVRTKFDNIDVVIIRENTEGEYVGLEHEVVPGVVESLKIITRSASERVARFAFEFARHNKRRRVTAIHKASVLKLSDGMFLDCCRRIATEYPDIEFKEALIELCSGYLISQPQRYDVLVLTNLAGDIVSDLAAGLVGGLGLTASLNKGEHTVLAEAVHGTAPDIAGKDLANPTALLLSAVLMLREMNLQEHADRIEKAIYAVLEEGKVLTGDLGGKARCSEYTLAIMEKL